MSRCEYKILLLIRHKNWNWVQSSYIILSMFKIIITYLKLYELYTSLYEYHKKNYCFIEYIYVINI